MNNELQKLCPSCGKTYPATPEFFYTDHSSRGKPPRLRSRCKKCYNIYNRKDSEITSKGELCCKKCGNVYPATPEFFCRIRHALTGEIFVRSPCKSCLQKKRGSNEPGVMNFTADPSDRCSACGTTKGNILGDVNKVTQQRYGYLCMKCYRIVHEFGKEPERLRSVLAYMKRTQRKRTGANKRER